VSAPGRRRLTVAYDGAPFAGWQIQPDRPTVQGELERALSVVARRAVRVRGAGRTDAGVHALGQVAHFDDPVGHDAARWQRALDGLLPPAIRARGIRRVPADFDATRDARARTYVYQLHLAPGVGSVAAARRRLPPHRRGTFDAVPASLDVARMRAAAARLLGRHDFRALSRAMEPGRPTVRTLRAVRVLRVPRGLRVVVTGDGFLYGMVRILAALLVEVGRGRHTPDDVDRLLASGDRARAPAGLPAHGLFLWRVGYAPVRGGDADLRRPDRW